MSDDWPQETFLPAFTSYSPGQKYVQPSAGGCILWIGAAGGGHHERNSRQGAETRALGHFGVWHGDGAESSAGSRSCKGPTAIRKAAGRAEQPRAAAGYGQSKKFQG